MIRKVTLKNFKSHLNTESEFSNLTVLCGTNAGGKSSVIQALLLLRESYAHKSQFEYLNLVANSVTIGTAQDALYQFSEKDEIIFKIETDIQKIELGFEIIDISKTLIPKKNHDFDAKKLNTEPLFGKDCQFISAARLGPQAFYPKNDFVVDVLNQISEKEGRAEYFVHFLKYHEKKDVLHELRLSYENFSPDLFSQVIAWEREISSGVHIDVVGNLNYELNYQFDTKKGKTTSIKASNVGFGLTYVMPIIVAILASPKAGIIFIENPEAHLHPAGQSKLTELICLAAQAGVQIVIETHSDHIINGILVQCKNFESTKKGIDRNNVRLSYFGNKDERQTSVVEKINILEGEKSIINQKGFSTKYSMI